MTIHTSQFILSVPEHRNYLDLVLAIWPYLRWRHAGFGALQAYIREGDQRELRVHLWHPSLVKPGIKESGLCHDHRFFLRSNVLVGSILQTEFEVWEDIEGDWETYAVTHARKAEELTGKFHMPPASACKAL